MPESRSVRAVRPYGRLATIAREHGALAEMAIAQLAAAGGLDAARDTFGLLMALTRAAKHDAQRAAPFDDRGLFYWQAAEEAFAAAVASQAVVASALDEVRAAERGDFQT